MAKTSHFNRFLVILGFISTLLAACGTPQSQLQASSQSQQGTIAVSGAFALYPMMVTWAEEYQKLHPGVRIDVSAAWRGARPAAPSTISSSIARPPPAGWAATCDAEFMTSHPSGNSNARRRHSRPASHPDEARQIRAAGFR